MTSLVDRLHPLPDFRRTPLSLLRWWESRRWFYNRAVGTAGLVTLAGLLVMAPDRASFFGPQLALAVAVYGLLANLCYSLGWLVEMGARLLWGRQAPDLGPLLFREGLIFSVGLTLFPLLVFGLVTVVRIVSWLL